MARQKTSSPRLDLEAIKTAASFRPLEILANVAGIPRDSLDGKHGHCPKCGGDDRFRMIDDKAGAVYCNQCFNSDNGDVFSAVQWMKGCSFIEAATAIGEYLGIKPAADSASSNGKSTRSAKSSEKTDPEESIRWLDWDEQSAVAWCRKKSGVLPIALHRVKARRCEHAGLICLAIPVWGEQLDAADPVGWTLYNITGGTLPRRGKQSTTDWVKVKLSHGSEAGIMADIAAITSPTCTTLWKVEGPSDLLTFLSLPDVPTHVSAVTNANGAGEIPRGFLVDLFTNRAARVIHDADIPGQDGATQKLCPALTTTATEVRNVCLPYPVAETHGKDLRDFANDGKTFQDLQALADTSPAFTLTPGTVIQINRDGTKQKTKVRGPSNGTSKADDDPHRLARVNLDQYAAAHGGGALRYWKGEWYGWKPARGKYRKIAEAELRAKLSLSIEKEFDRLTALRKAAGDLEATSGKVTTALVASVMAATASLCYVPDTVELLTWLDESRKDSGQRRTLIAMKNGLIDLDALLAERDHEAVIQHSERWFSTVCLPYAFDPDATCPKWESMLEKCLELDPERIKVLQEFVGYLLLPDTSFQKLLCLEGEGSNGKSSFLAGVTAIVGRENCSFISLEDFSDQFAMSDTLGKLANISADVPSEIDAAGEAVIKRFASGDMVSMNRKNMSRISVQPTARMIMSWNNRPKFKDRSTGIWRRIILCPFRVEITDNEKIFGMDKPEFWANSGELPGMFNWALRGLIRLRHQRRFTVSKLSQEMLEEYRTEANPAREFLSEFVEENAQGAICASDLYRHYHRWAKDSGVFPMSARQFGKEVRRIFPRIVRKKLGGRNSQDWYYAGIIFSVDEICGHQTQKTEF